MNRTLDTLRAIALRVALAVIASIGGLYVARHTLPLATVERCSDAVGNYLQTLGTIYAVLLAFVVFVVWSQFNDARQHVEQEGNELIDLFRTSMGLPEPLRAQLKAHLTSYVDAVLEQEWPAMARTDRSRLEAAGPELEQAFDELRAFQPENERDAALFGESLDRFNELHDARTRRLTSACMRVPLGMRLLLYGGAVMVVGSLYLVYVESFAIHAIITSALAGAISHVLYLVEDLDDPFSGDWQVPRAAFERAKRAVALES